MITIDPAIHFGFMGSIWKKRWRARNYSDKANSLACDESGRSLFIAFHEKSSSPSSEYYCSGLGPTRIRKANIRPLDQGIDSCSNDKRPTRHNLNKTKKNLECNS